MAVLIAIAIGVSLGAIAGYFGGKIDAVIMWLINIMWSIPTLLMVIAVTFALGKGVWQVYVAVGLTMWVEVARMVRGQVISAKQMQYVEAARALGFGKMRIIARHILPNIWGVVIVITASNFASAILMESGLSFLGLGAQSAYTFVGRDNTRPLHVYGHGQTVSGRSPRHDDNAVGVGFHDIREHPARRFGCKVMMLGKDRTRKHSFCSHFWCE